MRHGPIYLPHLTPLNKTLIIVLASVFLLNSVLGATMGLSLKYLTGLQGSLFFSGHIYKLLSWPLVAGSLFEILFDGLILWFIGSELEIMWGRRRYLQFLLSAVLGGGIFFLLVSWMTGYGSLLSGMSGVASAICLALRTSLSPADYVFSVFSSQSEIFGDDSGGNESVPRTVFSRQGLGLGHFGFLSGGFFVDEIETGNVVAMDSGKISVQKKERAFETGR